MSRSRSTRPRSRCAAADRWTNPRTTPSPSGRVSCPPASDTMPRSRPPQRSDPRRSLTRHGDDPMSLPATAVRSDREPFETRDWGLFLAVSFIWGASFLFIDIALDDFHPGLITWIRVGLGALALAVLPAARVRFEPPDSKRTCWCFDRVGRNPVHAVPARPAVHQLGRHRDAQRGDADLHRDHRRTVLRASQPGPSAARAGSSDSRDRLREPRVRRGGRQRVHRRRDGPVRHGVLRPRHQHRRTDPAEVRIGAGDGPHADAGDPVDHPVRPLRPRRVRLRLAAAVRTSCWRWPAPDWRSC
jgi:hypothetical protein